VPAPPSVAAVDKGAEEKPTVNMDDAELLATLIAKGDDRWSLATIRFKSNQMTRIVAMGSTLDDAEIVKVEEKRVTFKKGSQTGYIELIPGAAKRPAAPAQPPPPGKPPAPSGNAWQDALNRGVRMLGPNKYEIDRSLVNEFIANANVASQDAAIFPHTRDGKADGYRLGRVRPGGIFARLGLRSGDVVNSINNISISSPDKLLNLYTQLPGANHMTIGITRYGKPESIDYSIK
jgi:general secretion pathway protein C